MNVLGILRRTRGLSQGQVGAAVGIRPKTLSDYENGLRPTPQNLIKLAAFFGVPESEAPSLTREVPGTFIQELPRTVLGHVHQ